MYRQTTLAICCILLCITGWTTGSYYGEHRYEKNKAIDIDFGSLQYAASEPATPLELMENAGYNGENHLITTEDGYILEVHRVTGSKKELKPVKNKPAILLMHGLFASSSTWIFSSPETSLAFVLADAGYDVWLGNARGNMYSRTHVSLTVEDKDYWGFSWHEIGSYDLPAMIDYILKETGREKIFYVGHSQGTTSFFVMGSERPEYQNKVEAMFAMAPVAYASRMFSPVLQFLSKFTDVEVLLRMIGMYEFSPTSDTMKKFAKLACDEDAKTQPLCTNLIFLFCGYSHEQLNKTLAPVIVDYAPAGASTRQVMHYGQLLQSRKFRQYDHGAIGNMKRYGRLTPPRYDLGSIKTPIYLHYSTNDWLAHVRDVHQTYEELGNAVAKIRVPHEKFNHLDFIWGIDARTLVYNKIISLLSRYKD